MDNQKFFLIGAISLSVFLLWNQWQTRNVVNVNNTASKDIPMQQAPISHNTSAASNAVVDTDIPSVNSNNAKDLPNIIKQESHPFTTVITDLLNIEISHKGGTIQNAYLNAYPSELGSSSKFQLLNNKAGESFQAQSGLFPNKKVPTHQSMFDSEQTIYDLNNANEMVVPLTWQNENGIKVTKNFHFKKNSYLIKIDYQITNNSNEDLAVGSYNRLSRNEIDQSSMIMPTYTGGATYNDEDIFEKIDFDEFSSYEKTTSKGGWAAMIEHYFFAAWIADKNKTSSYSASVSNSDYRLTVANPIITIAPGATTTLAGNDLYIGPKEKQRINSVAPGLDKTVDYGVLFIIAKPLSELLNWIYSLVSSWGWSIIILTILIKLAFYKLSEKSYRSMAGMRKLAPRIEHIKKTYGDDKQKLGQKTMELYKKEKINPASGCLPILVQIPVFISLYWVLLEMVELRQTPFMYLPDLSAQDPYYILPVIMGISMFVQQKLNPAPPDPMQAKIMMSLPLIFTVFFLWFPSGLVLYWVVNNVLSIAQQWVINKRING